MIQLVHQTPQTIVHGYTVVDSAIQDHLADSGQHAMDDREECQELLFIVIQAALYNTVRR